MDPLSVMHSTPAQVLELYFYPTTKEGELKVPKIDREPRGTQPPSLERDMNFLTSWSAFLSDEKLAKARQEVLDRYNATPEERARYGDS